ARVRILDGIYDARKTRLDERVCARGRATEMAAGLERDIRGRTVRRSACRIECDRFRVRVTGALVPAFRNDLTVAREDTADTRIGMGARKAALRKLQCARHRAAIKGVELARHCAPICARSVWRGPLATAA